MWREAKPDLVGYDHPHASKGLFFDGKSDGKT